MGLLMLPRSIDLSIGDATRVSRKSKLLVLNEAGVDVRPGEVGELAAEGANGRRGYWQDLKNRKGFPAMGDLSG